MFDLSLAVVRKRLFERERQRPFQPQCARFVIDNLDEWTAWEESNG